MLLNSYRVGFGDKSNQEVVNRIVNEVKSHLPGISSVTVKGNYSGPSIIQTPSDKILEMPTRMSV